ncbi:MAG: DUF58 domain-containing protein [Chloroflexota bacterium]
MKPTDRFWAFLATSFVFWFFANQTQVGWLYIVSALLGGVLLTSWLLNRGTLAQITGKRMLDVAFDEVKHEGDDMNITLTLQNQGRLPASHLTIVEECPLAPPNSEQHRLPMFIPILRNTISFDYQTEIYQRGLHHFPALTVKSRAPFGFFERAGTHQVETSILIYPELRQLSRLSLLDEQPAAELTNLKAGIGSEVIGVRPYRAGDSPRHIHWRSVAKRGQLVSKEFAQETQPGVTVVLDRYCPLSPIPETKHQPFEISIKCAVSIADYAMRQGYPVHLAVDQSDTASPQGAVVQDALLQYMARVDTVPQASLSDVLNFQPLQQFVTILLSWVDDSVIETLIALKHRGFNLLVIIPDPVTFPIGSDVSAQTMRGALERNDISYRIIQHGDDWSDVISIEQAFDI